MPIEFTKPDFITLPHFVRLSHSGFFDVEMNFLEGTVLDVVKHMLNQRENNKMAYIVYCLVHDGPRYRYATAVRGAPRISVAGGKENCTKFKELIENHTAISTEDRDCLEKILQRYCELSKIRELEIKVDSPENFQELLDDSESCFI